MYYYIYFTRLAKHTLNTSHEDYDFVLIGITSSENQYFLNSVIGDALNFNFYLSDYIPFSLKEGRIFKFSLYRFLDDELGLEYFFIPNTSNFEDVNPNQFPENSLFAELEVEESVRLIKELPKTDYFIILKGENIHNVQHKVIDRLKTIPEIIQLQLIEATELQSKSNLIF